MIFDQKLIFSDQQAITATAVSTNVIDLGDTGRVYGASADLPSDQGKGKVIPIALQVTENFATLTSLTVTVETDDNAGFSSATTIATTGAIPLAALVAGYQFSINELPLRTNERYVRLNYTVGGSNATAGKITAGVTMGNQTAPL